MANRIIQLSTLHVNQCQYLNSQKAKKCAEHCLKKRQSRNSLLVKLMYSSVKAVQ